MKKFICLVFLIPAFLLSSCSADAVSSEVSEYDVFAHSSASVSEGSDTEENESSSNEVSELLSREESEDSNAEKLDYILNKSTKKFHFPDCRSVKLMKKKNAEYYSGTRDAVITRGYTPCKHCMP